MKQLYVCQKCEHTWEESYFIKVIRCPKCKSTDILGARYGVSCACKGKTVTEEHKNS